MPLRIPVKKSALNSPSVYFIVQSQKQDLTLLKIIKIDINRKQIELLQILSFLRFNVFL